MEKEKRDEQNRPDSKALQPDPETLHTTDPQEHMEGPLSSSMKGVGHAFESDESKQEADEKRDRHM